jgi:hypothetical protein
VDTAQVDTGRVDTSEPEQPPAWYVRAGRVAGAGLTGAAVGSAVAGIWHAGATAASNACGPDSGFCIPVGAAIEATFGAMLVIAAAVFLGFGVLRIRPLRLTIPVGCIIAAMLAWDVAAGAPGGRGPATWAAALAVGVGLAMLALSVDWGRPQVAGMIALAVVMVAAFVLPRVIVSPLGLGPWIMSTSTGDRVVAQDGRVAAIATPLGLPRRRVRRPLSSRRPTCRLPAPRRSLVSGQPLRLRSS